MIYKVNSNVNMRSCVKETSFGRMASLEGLFGIVQKEQLATSSKCNEHDIAADMNTFQCNLAVNILRGFLKIPSMGS